MIDISEKSVFLVLLGEGGGGGVGARALKGNFAQGRKKVWATLPIPHTFGTKDERVVKRSAT